MVQDRWLNAGIAVFPTMKLPFRTCCRQRWGEHPQQGRRQHSRRNAGCRISLTAISNRLTGSRMLLTKCGYRMAVAFGAYAVDGSVPSSLAQRLSVAQSTDSNRLDCCDCGYNHHAMPSVGAVGHSFCKYPAISRLRRSVCWLTRPDGNGAAGHC